METAPNAAPVPDPIDEQGGRTSGGGKAALDELVVVDEIGTDVSFAGSLSPATLSALGQGLRVTRVLDTNSRATLSTPE